MTNISGPTKLRLLAETRPCLMVDVNALRELAAQWEADLSARDHAVDLAGINAEAANELERRAERAQTQVALYEGRHAAQLGPEGREMSPRHRFNSDGICVRCGADAESDTGCVEELRAALERAQTALQEIANSLEADGGAPLSLAVAKAALSAASGGAA